jgi:uncharacterized protein YbbC (DUF1343 family)
MRCLIKTECKWLAMEKTSLLLIMIFINISCFRPSNYNISSQYSARVYTGLEQFIRLKAFRYKGKKAALITNHSGISFNLKQNLQLLKSEGIIIKDLFAPEHGIYGHEEEYSKTKVKPDLAQKINVFNMHNISNSHFSKLLHQSDLVIFDIQDMGMRCYTYISNLKRIMDLLENSELELIVLDRPNPISFLGIDGFDLNPKFKSKHISAFPAPFIYGLTIGEAALYYEGEFLKNINLTVVPMKNYHKDLLFTETSQPWVPPSPNLPSYKSSIIYTGVVLMEGINLSLGRGTANPFEYIGAPWIEPRKFSKALNRLELKGFKFRPIYFTPKYSKYSDKKCGGVQIFYTGEKFSPVEVSYKIIKLLMKIYPQCKWEKHRKSHTIDYLAGSDVFRKYISKRKSFYQLKKDIYKSRKKFYNNMRQYYLY